MYRLPEFIVNIGYSAEVKRYWQESIFAFVLVIFSLIPISPSNAESILAPYLIDFRLLNTKILISPDASNLSAEFVIENGESIELPRAWLQSESDLGMTLDARTTLLRVSGSQHYFRADIKIESGSQTGRWWWGISPIKDKNGNLWPLLDFGPNSLRESSVWILGDKFDENQRLNTIRIENELANTPESKLRFALLQGTLEDKLLESSEIVRIRCGNNEGYLLNLRNGEAYRGGNCSGDLRLDGRVKSVSQNSFYQSGIVSLFMPNSVTDIGLSAFEKSKLSQVTFSSSLIDIGDSAFKETDLTSLVLPDSVRNIGDSAFYGTKLTTIKFSNSLTSIGSVAFARTPLTSLVIPKSVTSIGAQAFAGTKLTDIAIPSSLTVIAQGVFASTPLKSVEIPNTVTEIQATAFLDTRINSLVIPNSVKSIGDFAFASALLDSITIGDQLESIGEGAFLESRFKTISLPKSVKSIGTNAFEGNFLLRVISIPTGLESMGKDVFARATALERVEYCGNLKFEVSWKVVCPATPSSNSVSPAKQKTTINCVKGKLTKKVTAVKPKCPSGYRLKK